MWTRKTDGGDFKLTQPPLCENGPRAFDGITTTAKCSCVTLGSGFVCVLVPLHGGSLSSPSAEERAVTSGPLGVKQRLLPPPHIWRRFSSDAGAIMFRHSSPFTLLYGVALLSLSVRKLLCRSRAGLDDPRPELPVGLDEPPRRPLPPFLFSLMMSSSDMLILSASVAIVFPERGT